MIASRPIVASVIASILCITAAGCAANTAPDSSGSADSNFTSESQQSGIDVQVLQVWTPGRVLPRVPVNAPPPAANDIVVKAAEPSECKVIETLPSLDTYVDTSVDCTAAFAKAAPFDLTGAAGPALTPLKFNVSRFVSSPDTYFVDPDYCNRIELRVVARDAALAAPSFAGVGFWTSRGESFTNKADLQVVGHTRLKNGDAASVLRFSGISTCISSAHNSTSGNAYQTFEWKPYAAFDADSGAGVRYRVWEKIAGNHALGRSWPGSKPEVNATAFDRQKELLAP
jgi:hypothetical protein